MILIKRLTEKLIEKLLNNDDVVYCKLTNQKMQTYNGFQWKIDEWANNWLTDKNKNRNVTAAYAAYAAYAAKLNLIKLVKKAMEY